MMKSAIRWALFLPAAALAAAIASMAVGFLGAITLNRYVADPHGLYVTLAQGFAMGVAFIAVGCSVAPGSKPWTPWLLAALPAVFLGGILVPAIVAARWADLASTVLMVVTAFALAWQASQRRRRPPPRGRSTGQDRPPGRVLQLPDGSWVRRSCRHTANMHRLDFEPLIKKDGEWVVVEQPDHNHRLKDVKPHSACCNHREN